MIMYVEHHNTEIEKRLYFVVCGAAKPGNIMMESVWLSLMLAINLVSILSVHPNVYIFYIPQDLLLLQFIT